MSKKIEYKTKGTCSRQIDILVSDNNIVEDIVFTGGCDGNLKGLRALCSGMPAKEVINKLKGIKCGYKSTSCPDQLACALIENLKIS